MADNIKLVQGDTRPAIVCTLLDDVSQLPISLVGATPRLHFKAIGSSEILATLTGSVTDGLNGGCVFYPAAAPEMLAGFGSFTGEIEITFDDGQIQTVYELLKFKVRQQF